MAGSSVKISLDVVAPMVKRWDSQFFLGNRELAKQKVVQKTQHGLRPLLRAPCARAFPPSCVTFLAMTYYLHGQLKRKGILEFVTLQRKDLGLGLLIYASASGETKVETVREGTPAALAGILVRFFWFLSH